jgi:GR25 family glycosyltransferase involved in LPS biosynthesis
MKFYTYLVAWDDVYSNCVEIDEQFMAAGQSITVINSGEKKRSHWHNVGDIRYYRQFYYAIKSFDMSYDYMAFLCGDVSYNEWSNIIDRANSVLTNYNNAGLYAPHLTHEPWSENASKIGQVEQRLNISIQTDGIFVFIHKSIVEFLLKYFNFLNKEIDLSEMKSGWGLDMIWSSISILNNLPIIRDTRYVPNHPAGSSYNHGRATEEMNIMLSKFYEFLEKTGIDSEDYKQIHGKIYGRMSQKDGCKTVSDFYKKFNLTKHNLIDYHIIYINDERKSNRELVNKTIVGNLHSIFALNARDPKELEKFHLDNKDFKIAWDGYKPGELGNFASHYSAWVYVIKNNLNSLLVFEDDVKVYDNFIDYYNIIMNNVPSDYDVMSIYVDKNQYPRYKSDDYINDYISKGYQDWSTLCYVISRQGAEKLVKYVNEIGMDHPTDWFIFRKGHSGIFNVYTVPPTFPTIMEIDKRYESQVQ